MIMKRFFFTIGRGVKFILAALGVAGRATVALVGITAITAIAANYTMTQGSGTTFASAVISGVNYAQHLICDATAGATQCAAVDAHGQQQIDVGTTNNNLYAAVTAAIPYIPATTPTTNTYTNGTTSPLNGDLHGGLFVHQTPQTDTSSGLAPGQAAMAASAPVVIANNQSSVPVTLSTTPTVANGNGVALVASTTNGSTPNPPIYATASDNHANIKNGAGTVYAIQASNHSATANYLRLYDAGTGFNGCNSATGIIFGMEIPPNDSGFITTIGGAVGAAFSTGLSICITSGFGNTDTTNATASAIIANVQYK